MASSYADLCFFVVEDRESEAARLVPPVLSWALHAARRDFAAFSSSITAFRAERLEDAISEILNFFFVS